MTEYKILEESRREKMEAAVNAARKDGYKPHGGLQVAGAPNSGFRYFLLIYKS